jgi:uncharacterized protein (UPF0212 family)
VVAVEEAVEAVVVAVADTTEALMRVTLVDVDVDVGVEGDRAPTLTDVMIVGRVVTGMGSESDALKKSLSWQTQVCWSVLM